MRELVFATNNKHKLSEADGILGDELLILNMDDINCVDDIEETGQTLEENALIKARHISEKYGCNCFADDTGLEVEALGGAPGVYSARYAGEPSNSAKNVEKLLQKMEDKEDRRARFRTVIALIINQHEYLFDGIIEGRIASETRGEKGFGYDPVFIPDGMDLSFAEMSPSEKNSMSHRARALMAMHQFLKTKERTS